MTPQAQTVALADVYAALRSACATAGGQGKWALNHGMSAQFVCDVLNARREPTDRILKPLGIVRRVVFERVRG